MLRNRQIAGRWVAARSSRYLSVIVPLACVSASLLASAAADPHTAADRPRIRLIATGGTIASRGGTAAPLSAEELVAAVPDLGSIAQMTFEQFSNLASDRIGPDDWLGLAQRVNAVLAHEADGVVITHGTDTLEETAYFLNLTVKSRRPVVVVGSMRPASATSADGPANLLNAARVAASAAAAGRGVLVVLNDEIHAARDVTKTNTLRLDTFRSRSFGPLGTIDGGQVRFYRQVERRHTVDAPFDITRLTPRDLPRVDIEYVYGGADGTAIDAVVGRGARGLVMAATGSGGLTPGQREAIARATAKGVKIGRAHV
jgi:L-asparaginase